LYSSGRERGRGKHGRFTGFRDTNFRRVSSILAGRLHRATDREEKDMNLKEKIVVPVVRLGKVETLLNRLRLMDLIACRLF
jgi:hypothetical protein